MAGKGKNAFFTDDDFNIEEVTKEVTVPTVTEQIQEPSEDLEAYAAPVGTQGRKGQKTPRMNLASPEDVYNYIRRESRREGMTYSEFICAVMRQRRDNKK